MPDRVMAKASLDTMRSLSSRELGTVCAALRLWLETDVHAIPEACYVELANSPGGLSDVDIRSLLHEIYTCRKVTICRSNA